MFTETSVSDLAQNAIDLCGSGDGISNLVSDFFNALTNSQVFNYSISVNKCIQQEWEEH